MFSLSFGLEDSFGVQKKWVSANLEFDWEVNNIVPIYFIVNDLTLLYQVRLSTIFFLFTLKHFLYFDGICYKLTKFVLPNNLHYLCHILFYKIITFMFKNLNLKEEQSDVCFQVVINIKKYVINIMFAFKWSSNKKFI